MTERAEKYQSVFGGVNGQWVLRDILTQMGMWETTHTAGDAQHSAFLEGQRSAALWILNQVEGLSPAEAQAMYRRAAEQSIMTDGGHHAEQVL